MFVASLLAAAWLVGCGGGATVAGSTAAAPNATTQQVGGGTVSAPAPSGATVPGGSATSVAVLTTNEHARAVPMVAAANGDVYTLMIGISDTGFPVLQRRDRAGAPLWSTVIEPACSVGWWMLGASEEVAAAGVSNCPSGHSLPGMTDVVLVRRDGSIASRFTTGLGAAVALNRFGEVIAWAADRGANWTTGPVPGGIVRPPTYLRLIAADGSDRWVWRDHPLSDLPLALRPATDGGVVGLTALGKAAFRLDHAGALLWWTELPAGFAPNAVGDLAELADGSVAVTGDTDGVVSVGAAQAGTDGRTGRALLVLRGDGRPRSIVPLPDPLPDQGRAIAPTALPGGGVVVWEQQFGCERLWAFGADLAPRWTRNVDGACAASLQSVVATRDALLASGWLNPTPAGGGEFGDEVRLAQGSTPTYFLLSIEP